MVWLHSGIKNGPRARAWWLRPLHSGGRGRRGSVSSRLAFSYIEFQDSQDHMVKLRLKKSGGEGNDEIHKRPLTHRAGFHALRDKERNSGCVV